MVRFRLAFDDGRGYVVGFAARAWTANVDTSPYQPLRVDIREGRAGAARRAGRRSPGGVEQG